MWLLMNDAYFSIVNKDCGPDELLVRARRPGDIEKVFGKVKVGKDFYADYLYRARVPRANVVAAITKQIEGIDYPNFKNSVKAHDLHNAYMQVWTTMSRVQNPPPYSAYENEGPDDGPKKPAAASLTEPRSKLHEEVRDKRLTDAFAKNANNKKKR